MLATGAFFTMSVHRVELSVKGVSCLRRTSQAAIIHSRSIRATRSSLLARGVDQNIHGPNHYASLGSRITDDATRGVHDSAEAIILG